MAVLNLKGVSKLGLGAFAGMVSAILGAFLKWILLPALVATNVDKVNNFQIEYYLEKKRNIIFLFVLANGSCRWNGAI